MISLRTGRTFSKITSQHEYRFSSSKVVQQEITFAAFSHLQPVCFDKAAAPTYDIKAIKKLESRIGIQQLSDWYQFCTTDIKKKISQLAPGDAADLASVKSLRNLSEMLRIAYPSHQWLEWKFKRASKRFWNDLRNQRAFFDHFEQITGMDSKNKWYTVQLGAITAAGGTSRCNDAATIVIESVIDRVNFDVA